MTRALREMPGRYRVGITSVLRRCEVGAWKLTQITGLFFLLTLSSAATADERPANETFVQALSDCVAFYEGAHPSVFENWQPVKEFNRLCSGCTTSAGAVKDASSAMVVYFNLTDRGEYLGVDCHTDGIGPKWSNDLGRAIENWAKEAIEAGRAVAIKKSKRRFPGEFVKFCAKPERPAVIEISSSRRGVHASLMSGLPTGMNKPIAPCEGEAS